MRKKLAIDDWKMSQNQIENEDIGYRKLNNIKNGVLYLAERIKWWYSSALQKHKTVSAEKKNTKQRTSKHKNKDKSSVCCNN